MGKKKNKYYSEGFVKFGKFCCNLYISIFYRVTFEGLENIPAEGGLIAASNHCTKTDPVLIGVKAKRHFCWMGKQELFDIKPVGWLVSKVGAFPVKRGMGDAVAAKHAVDLLKDGYCLGIFPQGTRSRDPENPVKAKYGVIRFAVEADVPIIPVVIYGKVKPFGKMHIKYGKPFKVQPKADGTAYTKAEYQEIAQNLLDDIYEMGDGSTGKSSRQNGNQGC